MLILWKLRRRDPDAGWVPTFERQMADVLAECLDRGIRVVANAGGLNPHGLKSRLEALGARLGPRAARRGRRRRRPVRTPRTSSWRAVSSCATSTPGELLDGELDRVATANAYLGGFGIAAALDAGADVVVTGRVTDASLVVGPAAWWHGWRAEDLDALAGAVVAGHVDRVRGPDDRRQLPVPRRARRGVPGLPDLRGRRPTARSSSPSSRAPAGRSPSGPSPPSCSTSSARRATTTPTPRARFDTIQLAAGRPGPRRGHRGRGARRRPTSLKVALNFDAGLPQHDDARADRTRRRGEGRARDLAAARTSWAAPRSSRASTPSCCAPITPTRPSNPEATALLRVTVMDTDKDAGRAAVLERGHRARARELRRASTRRRRRRTPRPTGSTGRCSCPATRCTTSSCCPTATRVEIPHARTVASPIDPPATPPAPADLGPTTRRPLGDVCGARSGDKGGNANVGLWTPHRRRATAGSPRPSPFRPLRALLTEAAELEVRRYELPNLRALNFVVVGLLGDGVASSTRYDPQAKGLGEYLRSRFLDVPDALVAR